MPIQPQDLPDRRPALLAQTEDSLAVAAFLSASGGFLDAFTYIAHDHVFANAMTGNVVLFGVYLAAGNWLQSLRHIPPLLAFLLGIATAQTVRLSPFAGSRYDPAVAALTAEMIFLLAAGWYPRQDPSLPLVLGISFLAALQSSMFRRVGTWSYNSTMTTGNLRDLAESLFKAIFTRAQPESLRRAKFFAAICLSFLAGAVLGGLCTPALENRALWVVDLLLLCAWTPLMLAWRQSNKTRIRP